MQPTLKCGRPNPEYFGQDREEIPIGFADRVTRDVPRATMEKARARRDAILADYSDVAEEAMRCLEEGFESAMTVLHLDEYLRRYYRTSTPLERPNKELKRRSKVIGIFPNGDSVIRLMGSVLVEHHNACQAKRKIFSPDNYQKLMNSGTRLTLIHVAQQQHQLLVA